MNETLFTIDNTEIIVQRVRESVEKFKQLNGKCDADMVLHFIRNEVCVYTELPMLERIKYVEEIYEEHFKEEV